MSRLPQRSRAIRHLYEDAQSRIIENSSTRYWSFRISHLIDHSTWNYAPEQPPTYGTDPRRMDGSLEHFQDREWIRHGVHEAKKTDASPGEIQICETQCFIGCRDSCEWFRRARIFGFTTIGTTIKFWLFKADDPYLTPWGPGITDYIDDSARNFDDITRAFQQMINNNVQTTGSQSPRPSNVVLPVEWQGYETSSQREQSGASTGYGTNRPYTYDMASPTATRDVATSGQSSGSALTTTGQDSTEPYTYSMTSGSSTTTRGVASSGQSSGLALPTTGQDATKPYTYSMTPGSSATARGIVTDQSATIAGSFYSSTIASDAVAAGSRTTPVPEASSSSAGPAHLSREDDMTMEDIRGEPDSESPPATGPEYVEPYKYVVKEKKKDRLREYTYYRFNTPRGPVQTEASDWKRGTIDGQPGSIYTGKKSGKQYYTWELPRT
ncbi:hypothetical protein HYALB_00002216 [Hymenoscyphus albidus]|uniref:Uncharacterized protein n=1 Tax=Hymenoscyphus albidus TaxID=595503 RepID=A0A9N9PZ97_9HELO|nr:hypothetical protein HYALB_00002216 [Hymenoscyphus albidus]